MMVLAVIRDVSERTLGELLLGKVKSCLIGAPH